MEPNWVEVTFLAAYHLHIDAGTLDLSGIAGDTAVEKVCRYYNDGPGDIGEHLISPDECGVFEDHQSI